MKKSIYNVYVEMKDQEQCDRMKQLCVDNGLPYWDDETAFEYISRFKICSFTFDKEDNEFYIINPYNAEQWYKNNDMSMATEQKFIELLKQHKMNPDDYIEGTFDSRNPANINEIEVTPQTELEEQQEWNQELLAKVKKMKTQLTKLAEIEQSFTTFGNLSHEEQKEKNEILNQYTKQ